MLFHIVDRVSFIIPIAIIILWLVAYIRRPVTWLYVYLIFVLMASLVVLTLDDFLFPESIDATRNAALVMYLGVLTKFLGYLSFRLSSREPTENQIVLFSLNAKLLDLLIVIVGLAAYMVFLLRS